MLLFIIHAAFLSSLESMLGKWKTTEQPSVSVAPNYEPR